jgi:ferric-dicitrate binding protein FerR (iron transport regulator)
MKEKHSHIIHNYLNGKISLSELKGQLPAEDFQYWKDTLHLLENFPVSNFDSENEFKQLIIKRNINAKIKKDNKFNLSNFIKVAAVFIFLVCSTVLINYYYLNQNAYITTITYNQDSLENTVILPDNSKAYLNKESSISYNRQDWDDKRSLNLKGEAYFDVEEGEKFIVKTDLGWVQVLGTTFDVSNHNRNFSVTCYTGKVSVSYNNKKIILNPGQSFSNTSNKVEIVNRKMPNWLIKQSIFEATPLTEVVKDIEKHKNIKIDIILDKNYTFTGGYQHKQSPEVILKLISETLGLSYRQINDNHFELMNQ